MSPQATSGTAGPSSKKKATARKSTSTRAKGDPALELANRVAELMLEKKAADVAILAVGSLTSFADYFVLGSCQADRQVQALGRHLAETLKKEGHPALSTEGEQQSHWVLMDFGGVVAHVFYEPAREYYDLDGLWADAPRVSVEDTEAEKKAAARKKAASDDPAAPAAKPRARRARSTDDADA
ncbi:MAG: ribosome silencing factor [Deltaproteobacteria bacterium]|nr:ribosome silencing factor [Deltaproteobacteria bacterium]